MISDMRKAPFPYFGGKRDAASVVWAALGDVSHYVEPFFGSGAVLLNRPHPANRTYFSETVNDADGLLINFHRSVQWSPELTAEAASWPVTEADKHARSCFVLSAANTLDLEHLMGDPHWHDPVLAGWWVWCVCVSIGAFGSGGPWWPDTDGRLKKWAKGEPRPPVGVSRQIPHLGDDGQGINHAGTREPGVPRGTPHLIGGGRGVNAPQLREPGVSREIPHLGDDGKGVNHAGTREFGVGGEPEFHPMTMPQLTAWFRYLSARLRHVRILNGDWARAVGNSSALTLPVRQGKTPAGVFLDPPYVGAETMYREDTPVAEAVAHWAVSKDTDPRWRIVAAGYADDTTHNIYLDAGWTEVEWFKEGYLKGGYGTDATRDRLYLNPRCLQPADTDTPTLFDTED